MPFEDKLSLLRHLLECVDLQSKVVLDAGAGRGSARAVLERHPARVVFVCGPKDSLKSGHVREEQAKYPDISSLLLQVDLGDATCLQPNSFDFILADYLLSALRWGMHLRVLANFYQWLRPGGRLLLVDIEPPVHTTPAHWTASALLFWQQFLHSYNQGIFLEPYHPGESVASWLARLGFLEVRMAQYDKPFDRTWAQRCYEHAVSLLPLIGNDALRFGIQEELNRLKSFADEQDCFTPPGITWTKNYAIDAWKGAGSCARHAAGEHAPSAEASRQRDKSPCA